jgi:hypothetical protein
MTNLIVRRPKDWHEGCSQYQITIDDKRVVAIEPGQTVWIGLEPGLHQVMAREGEWRGESLEIELYAERSSQMIVAQNRKLGWAAQPSRVRFTLRGTMIIVALVAVFFAGSRLLSRYEGQSYLRREVAIHADLEALVRQIQAAHARSATDLEKQGHDATSIRQSEAKAAARADHHAAMRRKYEQALSQGRFTVEDDPLPPPWP